MTELNWQDFFREQPCGTGWRAFAAAVAAHGLDYAVRNAPDDDRRWGARNTHRADLLAVLATGADTVVRWYVARKTATPAETLALLATDADTAVRYCVAENTATPAETLALLATDADTVVRRAVAENMAVRP